MSLPPEILRQLAPGTQLTAQAAISSSPSSSIGETRLVLAGGRLLAFVRESLIGDFAPMELDHSFTPVLEGGDFSAVLRLRKADGAAVALTVSSFERADVAAVLAALALAAPMVQAAPMLASLPAPVPLADIAPAVEAGGAAVPARPPVTPETRVLPEPLPPKDGKWRDEFAGDTPFATGCLPTLVVMIGLCVGLWCGVDYLQGLAFESTGREVWTWDFVNFVCKAVAIVAGLTCGVFFGMWLDGVNFRANTTGKVTINHGRVAVLAPKGVWKLEFPLSRAQVEFLCHKGKNESNTKPEDESYSAMIRLTLEDQVVGLWIHSVAWKEIAGPHWQNTPVQREQKPQHHLDFLSMTFSPMHARLLRELHLANRA